MFVAPNYRQHFHVDLDWDNVSDLILKETTIRCALQRPNTLSTLFSLGMD